MITQIQATLECEVCGAGWRAKGEFLPHFAVPFDALNGVFMADESQECPECGEEGMWDIAKPEGEA